MKYLIVLALAAATCCSCGGPANSGKVNAADRPYVYPTVSYLDIKLDSQRHLPQNPVIATFTNGRKQLVFCGVSHLEDYSDTQHPMFTAIEKSFFACRPGVCINEGGDVSQKKYASCKAAILQDGEIGLLKVLGDSLQIPTVNGDMTDSLEFRALIKKYTAGEFLAYIVTERLMWSLRGAGIKDTLVIPKKYDEFIRGYIMKKGAVALQPAEQGFDFYRQQYAQLVGRPFNLATLKPTDPFDPEGRFQEIGRASKEFRDQFLLARIDSLLHSYDKVFVVFGGWHLLTCEPGLQAIIQQQW